MCSAKGRSLATFSGKPRIGAPKRVPKQTGTKMSSFQNSKKLDILMPIRFDTPLVGAPGLGSAEGGYPDLFRFPRFLPICSDLRSLFSGIPRFVPICSVFFRFVPICFQNKPEQIRESPFCRPLLQIPDLGAAKDTLQTGTKTNKRVPKCLVFQNPQNLPLETIRFDASFGFAERHPL